MQNEELLKKIIGKEIWGLGEWIENTQEWEVYSHKERYDIGCVDVFKESIRIYGYNTKSSGHDYVEILLSDPDLVEKVQHNIKEHIISKIHNE